MIPFSALGTPGTAHNQVCQAKTKVVTGQNTELKYLLEKTSVNPCMHMDKQNGH